MVGKGIQGGSKSCIRLMVDGLLLYGCQKISLRNIIFEPESRCPITMAPRPLLLNHPKSLDTSPKWFWMVGKGIHGL
jgi:hypothetical protein